MAIELWLSQLPVDKLTVHQLILFIQEHCPNVRILLKTWHFQKGHDYCFILVPDNLRVAVYVIDHLKGQLLYGQPVACDFSRHQQLQFIAAGLDEGKIPALNTEWEDPLSRHPAMPEEAEPEFEYDPYDNSLVDLWPGHDHTGCFDYVQEGYTYDPTGGLSHKTGQRARAYNPVRPSARANSRARRTLPDQAQDLYEATHQMWEEPGTVPDPHKANWQKMSYAEREQYLNHSRPWPAPEPVTNGQDFTPEDQSEEQAPEEEQAAEEQEEANPLSEEAPAPGQLALPFAHRHRPTPDPENEDLYGLARPIPQDRYFGGYRGIQGYNQATMKSLTPQQDRRLTRPAPHHEDHPDLPRRRAYPHTRSIFQQEEQFDTGTGYKPPFDPYVGTGRPANWPRDGGRGPRDDRDRGRAGRCIPEQARGRLQSTRIVQDDTVTVEQTGQRSRSLARAPGSSMHPHLDTQATALGPHIFVAGANRNKCKFCSLTIAELPLKIGDPPDQCPYNPITWNPKPTGPGDSPGKRQRHEEH